MNLKKHKRLFDLISPGYNLFFKSQVKNYSDILAAHSHKINIPKNGRILDLGCGTGTFTVSWSQLGYDVVGVDISNGMRSYAVKRGIDCRYGNVIQGLDFEDNSFDLVTAAYVAHGLDRDKRSKMFTEAARISKGKVLFHDYGDDRNIMTDIIEFVEGGDYFNFIKTGKEEMNQIFGFVDVLKIRNGLNWYICTVKDV